MRQLYFEGPRQVRWHDVPEPRLAAGHEALVSPIAATTCDVDFAVLAGLSPFRPPFALGHEAVCRVVDVGDDVEGLAPGDVVSVPYHRTCGRCDRCARGTPLHCERKDVPAVPSYGFPHAGEWGGMLSERFRVPYASHALVRVPQSVDPLAAVSAGDNLADAWSTTVPHIEARRDARVLVMSFGGYGLYAVQWSLAAGARSVTYVDHDAQRREIARSLGAEPRAWTPDLELEPDFDVIVNARPGADSLRAALGAAAPDAVCESTAIFFEDVPLPLGPMHASGVRFRSTFSSTRNYMPRVLAELAAETIDPRAIESEIMELDDVPERFAELTHKPIVRFEAG